LRAIGQNVFSGISLCGWFLQNIELSLLYVDNPIFGNISARVDPSLAISVPSERAVGNFDNQENVFSCWVLLLVVIGIRSEEWQYPAEARRSVNQSGLDCELERDRQYIERDIG
jgi:hypothetical protein